MIPSISIVFLYIIFVNNSLSNACDDRLDRQKILVKRSNTDDCLLINEIPVIKYVTSYSVQKFANTIGGGVYKHEMPCLKFKNSRLVVEPNAYFYEDPDGVVCRSWGDRMKWYTGHKSYTASRRKCQRWDDAISKRQNLGWLLAREKFLPESFQEMQNFCRNPDDSLCGAWCFVEGDHKYQREPCFKICYPEEQSGANMSCVSVKSFPSKGVPQPQLPVHPRHKTTSGKICNDRSIDGIPIDHIYTMPPLQNRIISGVYDKCPFGWMCQTAPPELQTWPNHLSCEALRVQCLDVDSLDQLSCYKYMGRRSYTISGKSCLPWASLLAKTGGYKLNGEQTAILTSAFSTSSGTCTLNGPINSCLNLYSHGLDHDRKFDSFRFGPMCFVDAGGGVAKEERCFYTCKELFIKRKNCVRRNMRPMNIFSLFKNTTFDKKPCQKWFPIKFKLGYDKTSENNCRLVGDNEEEDVPVCRTGGSNLEPQLTKCYPECGADADSVSMFRAWSYSPCSAPGTKSCCQSKVFEDTTTAVTTAKSTTPVSTDKKLRFPMPIELEEDEEMEESLKGFLQTNSLLKLMIAVFYIVSVIVLVIMWKKVSRRDWREMYGGDL